MSGKAKRARERVRMETRQQVLDRVSGWIENDSWPDGPFNACNLDVGIHADNCGCDGNCVPLSKWETAVACELQLWTNEGANPQINSTELKLEVLLNYLIEKDMFTKDEMSDLFHEKLYEVLSDIRNTKLQEMKREQLRKKLTAPINGN